MGNPDLPGLHPERTLATNHVAEQGDDVEQGRGLGGEFLGGSRALLCPTGSFLTDLFDLPQRRSDALDGPVLLATAAMNLFNKRSNAG